MKISAFLAFIALATAMADVPASDWKPIEGTYAVTPQNYLDPSESEPKDSHLRFQLTGDAAKDLYRAMKVREETDECAGAIAKRVGEMQCLHYKSDGKFACDFSIDAMRQVVVYGVAC